MLEAFFLSHHENHKIPPRCPVKLYIRVVPVVPEHGAGVGYEQERSVLSACVPDSPAWNSTELFNPFSLEKMITRPMMIRKLHMQADQNSQTTGLTFILAVLWVHTQAPYLILITDLLELRNFSDILGVALLTF